MDTSKKAVILTGSMRGLESCSTSMAIDMPDMLMPQVSPDPTTLNLLTPEIAEKLCALPLARRYRDSQIIVSFLVPKDAPKDLSQTLRFIVDTDVELIEVERKGLQEEIFRHYRGSLQNVLSSQISLLQEVPSISYNAETDRVEKIILQADGRAAKFVRSLLDYCIAHEASDLHLTPENSGVKANIRVNGQLLSHDNVLCPTWTFEKIIQILKLLVGGDTTIKFRPQDGSFSYRAGEKNISVRVSLIPTVHGERAVLRFLGAKQIKGLLDLGYSPRAFNFIRQALAKDDGLILLAGATGSGKTTAMYGAIHELKRRNLNISTIENPVEQAIAGISQTQINEAQGLDYSVALKAIMRQDPDVILVGETRDSESAAGVINAALTGHLVLTTVHGRTVFDAAKRVMTLAADSTLVPDALRLVVYQRLAPRLCPSCKIPDLNATRLALNHPLLNLRRMFIAGGCARCNFSGFIGQVPVPEILLMNPDIAEQMKYNLGFNKANLVKLLNESNYISLEESILELLSTEEIPYPEDL